MKTMKFLSTTIFATALIFSCSSDDDSTPEPVLEEEVITTMTITLTADGQADVILQTQDLDGDGPNLPVVTVSGDLSENTMYSGSIVLLNETEDPAENITEEIEEEALEHQFFYTIGNGLNAETDYNDADSDGNPIGLDFVLSTNSVSSGSITFTLRHEPTKPNMGIEDAGGETDIEATFDIAIQ
ncbi:MAG: type 1 periplasmic binding fold superfamily protein [Flavobacteriales bacterium]|jgi:hypothetical protein